MNSVSGLYRPASKNHKQGDIVPLLRQPWLVCAVVVLVALMSSYVHVLNGHVQRGERLRGEFAQTKTGATKLQQLRDSEQSQTLTVVGPDTAR